MTEPKLLCALLALLSVLPSECFPRGRILGGSQSKLYSRPYMVSLQANGSHICGGVLIAQDWVLSAAHCIPDSANKTLQAVLGANALSDPKRLVYTIDMQIVHPQYNRTTRQHDLLLLKLPEKIPLSELVRPLPYQKEDVVIKEKTLCLVAGWGKIKRTGKKPDSLNEVWVPVISSQTCNRRDYYHGEITDNMMCAGDNRRDSCEGDSGGPLVCDGVVEAIVSTGSNVCGNLRRPGVYTRIYPYVDWIDQTMRDVAAPSTPAPTVKV